MLVYANEFYLERREDDLENLKSAIKRWLGKKIGREFSWVKIIPMPSPFTTRNDRTGHNEVRIFGTPDQAPDYCLSITYRHECSETKGRAWVTRIGIERHDPADPLHVTFVLETIDVSAQVGLIPVQATLPGVVGEIIRGCGLDPKTPGGQVLELNDTNVETFRKLIDDRARDHVLVVVSPDDFSEEPNVDVDALQSKLVGLAQVLMIPTKHVARRLKAILPPFHTAWDGSIALIQPNRTGFAFGRVYRLEEIEDLIHEKSVPFEQFLFEELTHRFNLAKSRRHISDDVVSRRLIAYKLEKLREENAGMAGMDEIVHSYEEERNRAKSLAEDLELKLLSTEEMLDQSQQEKADLERQIRALQYQLSRAKVGEGDVPSANTSADVPLPESLEALIDWVEEQFTERIVLTNHAQKTLKDSPFEDVTRVAETFRLLANEMHPVFSEDRRLGDVIGLLREIPAKYSGNQSEVTAGRKGGYERSHNGRKYSLQKHISLGTARDPRHCFRLYFEWEPAEGKIIVLHAGEHLDTLST